MMTIPCPLLIRYALLAAVGAAAGCDSSPTAWAEPVRAAASAPARAALPDAGVLTEPMQALPSPPKLARSPRLACGKDSDCAIVPPRPCMCPPCGVVWREVLSKRELAKLQASWAKKRCVRKPCPPCESRLLGSKAVCRAGQCAVE